MSHTTFAHPLIRSQLNQGRNGAWKRVLCLSLLCGLPSAVLLPACDQNEDPNGQEHGQSGTLALRTLTVSEGQIYRLRNAKFRILGPTHLERLSEDFLDEPSINVDVIPGVYQIILMPGWYMERSEDSYTWETLASARLVGPPNVFAAVVADRVSNVTFNFRVLDHDVDFATGSLDVGIAVDVLHCGNGILEPGEACDDGNQELETCPYGLASCDVCTPICTLIPGDAHFCGDGKVDVFEGESCDSDDAPPPYGCTSSCEAIESAKRIFVSSTASDASLGGSAGADARCQSLADAQGLDGIWRALLATGSTDGNLNRLTHHTGPYQRLDGITIATHWDDLVTPTIRAPINVDETGAILEDAMVWTGLLAGGSLSAGPNCLDWTTPDPSLRGFTGNTSAFDSPLWATAASSPCIASAHLYCIEQ
jgi:hypothetical protein